MKIDNYNSENVPNRAEKTAEYTDSFKIVVEAEKDFLKTRRRNVGGETGSAETLPELSDNNIWGIALSGGGIRSATFCLGVIQGLTLASKTFKKGIFRRFDYLSSVSGGGYIATCLSSILAVDKDAGVNANNSPFTGLRVENGLRPAAETENSVMHQLHHLRSKGNYLAANLGLMSFEWQRFVGTALFGALHNILLFSLLFLAATALLHLGLSVFGGGDVVAGLKSFGYASADATDIARDSNVFMKVIGRPICVLWMHGLNMSWGWKLGAAILGSICTIVAILWSICRAERIASKADSAPCGVESGLSIMEEQQQKFIRRFNLWSLAAVGAATLLCALCFFPAANNGRIGTIFLPLWFALGGAIGAFAFAALLETGTPEVFRLRRSFYATVKGGALLGVLAALAAPLVLTLMFAASNISFSGISPALFFAISAFLFSKSKAGGLPKGASTFLKENIKPLLNATLFLTLLFAVVPATRLLTKLPRFGHAGNYSSETALIYAVLFAAAVCLMCFLDANRLSPFNFYRDRLVEAYLQTFARVTRHVPAVQDADATQGCQDRQQQGMALKLVSNRESIKVADLISGTMSGPYHLMTAALNVSGANDLLRKDTKSHHFLFSPLFVGSKETGYQRTAGYHGTTLRASRAMSVSGAASSSGMGMYSFAAQAFFVSLFNLRLGQWMNNPWWARPGKKTLRRTKPTFWLPYLLRELFGKTNAQTRRILLSDGGHTGDNLGLLPLLQRRCAVIVVADADKDEHYTFDSFNNAVRMANVEENIVIDVDLTPLQINKETMQSHQSVVVGLVHYPEILGEKCKTTGLLIYLKSSVSEHPPSSLQLPAIVAAALEHKCIDETARPKAAPDDDCKCNDADWHLPAHVENYNRKNTAFPHDSTGDQFYDSEQFEAYRALGEHVARQAATILAKL